MASQVAHPAGQATQSSPLWNLFEGQQPESGSRQVRHPVESQLSHRKLQSAHVLAVRNLPLGQQLTVLPAGHERQPRASQVPQED